MTKLLYMDDSYLKSFNAKIINVKDEKFIVLDETAFYPTSGGQQCDYGSIFVNNQEFKVINVIKSQDEIIHEVDRAGLQIGMNINGEIDWSRRYAHMKSHTAAHIISTIIHKEMGALISGNQLYENKFRVDFDLENFDRELFIKLIEKANSEIKRGLAVKSYYLSREEAIKIPGIIKLANALPPTIDTLRIIEIVSLDIQADGGTHVANTNEIGTLKFESAENKGKGRKRVTISIE